MLLTRDYLLDTNFISELKRPRPNRNVVSFIDSTEVGRLYVSTITLAELRYGADIAPNRPLARILSEWLAETVRPMFLGRTLPLTEEIILRWRYMAEAGRKAGRNFSQPDLFLAATALEHNLTLVTRNVKDFTGIGLPIVNPWDDDSGTIVQ